MRVNEREVVLNIRQETKLARDLLFDVREGLALRVRSAVWEGWLIEIALGRVGAVEDLVFQVGDHLLLRAQLLVFLE